MEYEFYNIIWKHGCAATALYEYVSKWSTEEDLWEEYDKLKNDPTVYDVKPCVVIQKLL